MNSQPSYAAGSGPDAGLPGTNFLIAFERSGASYSMAPVNAAKQHDRLELWRSYSREQIPSLFGEKFNRARRQTGFVTLPNHILLLVTLNKTDMEGTFRYEDRFLTPEIFKWQSQNRTSQQSEVGQTLRQHHERGIDVHLFVRKEKRTPSGSAAPFIYCGELEFIEWEGERSITIRWRLLSPLPSRLQQLFLFSPGE
jgi:Domain of unknown function (DUF3427)